MRYSKMLGKIMHEIKQSPADQFDIREALWAFRLSFAGYSDEEVSEIIKVCKDYKQRR